MMAETGSSGLRPAAITRDRRSRSVTMPNVSPCRTRTALAPSAVIRWAAARIGSLPGHSSGGLRISAATRRCPGSFRRRPRWAGRARSRSTGHEPRGRPAGPAAGAPRPRGCGSTPCPRRPGPKPVGSPEIIEAWPTARPAEQVQDPPVVDDLDRARADHPQVSPGPHPAGRSVPRGLTSVSVTAATRARSSAPTASNGGREPRKSATPRAGPGPEMETTAATGQFRRSRRPRRPPPGRPRRSRRRTARTPRS